MTHPSAPVQVLVLSFLYAGPKLQVEKKKKTFPLPGVLVHGAFPSGRNSNSYIQTDLFSCSTDNIIAKLSEQCLILFCLVDERFMLLDHRPETAV